MSNIFDAGRLGRALLLVLLNILLAAPVWGAEEGDQARQALESQYQALMREQNIAGGVMVLSDGKGQHYETHVGLADIAKNRPAAPDTIYGWGSITKTFTAIAIMQLEGHGKLNINDPLVKYIPAFATVNNPYGGTERITLASLMSHTSGLQNGSFIIPLEWEKPWPTWQQLEPVLNYIKVTHEVGSRYRYSNLGVLLLGRVIEVVTGDDYEVYIDKNILKPLQMYESYFDTTPYHLASQKAQGYRAAKEGTHIPYHPDIDQGVTTSNGGLKASVVDFHRYMDFLRGSPDPARQAVYDAILPRHILLSMWRPRAPLGEGRADTIGLGFHIYAAGEHLLVGHSGSANGFQSLFLLEPESGLGLVLVANTENARIVHNAMKDNFIAALEKLVAK